MIRIAITPAAYDAIAATLPLGSVAYEAEPKERGERTVWLEAAMVDRLTAMRRPGETLQRHLSQARRDGGGAAIGCSRRVSRIFSANRRDPACGLPRLQRRRRPRPACTLK